MKYRQTAPPYEATPSYYYTCTVCTKLIKGPRYIGHSLIYPIHISGDKVVDVLHNGKTITIHEHCNN